MSDVAIIEKWINVMLRTIRDNSIGPTYATRLQYLVATIIYYAFACYYGAAKNCIIEPELQLIYLEDKDLAYVDCIIYTAMTYLYDLLGYNKSGVVTDSKAMNNRISMIISNLKKFFDRRDNDGWKVANIQPVYPNGDVFIDVNNVQDLNSLLPNPHLWTPLNNPNGTVQKYLTPEWGNVKPVENIDVTGYIKVLDENLEGYNLQNGIKEVLSIYEKMNDNQRVIAEYFRGGQVTPPGIWIVWGLYATKASNMGGLDASKFFYLLTSTMFTAGVVCWNAKKKYMHARPLQEIRLLPEQTVTTFDGTKVSNKIWKTFQPENGQTPPFAAMTSGHSTFSSSAAVIFDKFFPEAFSKYNFGTFTLEHGIMISGMLNNSYPNTVKTIMVKTNSSDVVHTGSNLRFPMSPIKMEFTSWRQLAELSGISRLYGGIHTSIENHGGLITGEMIGRDILNRAGM
jgi:hypothetical protein